MRAVARIVAFILLLSVARWLGDRDTDRRIAEQREWRRDMQMQCENVGLCDKEQE